MKKLAFLVCALTILCSAETPASADNTAKATLAPNSSTSVFCDRIIPNQAVQKAHIRVPALSFDSEFNLGNRQTITNNTDKQVDLVADFFYADSGSNWHKSAAVKLEFGSGTQVFDVQDTGNGISFHCIMTPL